MTFMGVRGAAIAGCLLALVCPTDVQAQNVLSSEVYSRLITADGKLAGCSIEFDIIFKDYVYLNGMTARVTGSLNWLGDHSVGIGFLLKAGGSFYDRRTDTVKPAKVHHAFVLGGRKPHLAWKRIPCDEQLAYCGVYTPGEALKILTDSTNGLEFKFNRNADGLDMGFPLNLEKKEYLKLLDCIEELASPSSGYFRR